GTRWVRRLAEQGMSPAQLDLLGSCFEDNPADRPASAVTLAAALRGIGFQSCHGPTGLESYPTPAPPGLESCPTPVHRIGGLRRFDGPSAAVESVAFSHDGRHGLSGGADRAVRVWDLDSGLELRRFDGLRRWVLSVAFSPDGRRVLCGS